MGAAQKQGDISELDLQHPYLRNCKTRTIANKIDMLATVPCQLPTFKKWKEDLQSSPLTSQAQQYLLLPKNHKFDDGGVCSTSGELTLQYDYFPRLLTTEIASRKAQNRKFTEGQLWYLLYALTILKNELSHNGELIGDPHPRNIFLNGNGQIKIASLRSWPGQVNNYRRAVLQLQSGYLSPEDIERLKLGAMDNQSNSQSEIFAFGLILLSSASLHIQRDLYQMKEKQFSEEIFFSRLSKFQHDKTYSQIFRAVTSNLLQLEPLKRMSLQELHKFLAKHGDNIVAKIPLRIDNVGKKLQKTINEMLKIIHPPNEKGSKNNLPPLSPPIIPIPFQSSQTKAIDINPPHQIQTNVRQSNRLSEARNKSIDERRLSQNKVLPPPQPYINGDKKIAMNPYNPSQPSEPFISTYKRTFSTTQMPKKSQAVSIQSPKYKPFQSILTGQNDLKNQNQPKIVYIEKETTQIKQNKIIQESKVLDQPYNPKLTQIWNNSQTSIGQLNLLIQTKGEGFGHNSLITPSYHPEMVQPPSLQSIIPLVKQTINNQNKESQPLQRKQEKTKQFPLSKEMSLIKQNIILATQAKIVNKPQSEIKQQLVKQVSPTLPQPKVQLQTNKSEAIIVKPQIKLQSIPQEYEERQQQINKKIEQLKQKFNLKQIDVKLQPNNYSKQIKQIQASQFNSNSKSFLPTVKLWGVKPNTTSAIPSSSLNTINIKSVQANQSLTLQQPINKLINIAQSTAQQQIIKEDKDQNQIKPVNKYILIQESKDSALPINSIDLKSTKQSGAENRQKITEQQSEIIQYHTYIETITEGSFEECWQEILVLLKDPTDYSSLIDPEKVKVRILEDRWSLKVGPGIFDILLNKEQGKFLLSNCIQESLCEGQMLGGVYKDENKKHRIWFNSAYYYKGKKVPSRELIEESLRKCKQNIERAKK